MIEHKHPAMTPVIQQYIISDNLFPYIATELSNVADHLSNPMKFRQDAIVDLHKIQNLLLVIHKEHKLVARMDADNH